MAKINCLIIVFAFFSFNIYAQTENDFNVTQLRDGTLAISGSNNIGSSILIPSTLFDMRVSVIENNAFFTQRVLGNSVIISEGITQIGNRAFSGYFFTRGFNNGINRILLPRTLRNIGIEAFSPTALQYSFNRLEYSTRGVNYETFSYIKSLIIPNSVEQVGIGAFNFMAIDYLKIERAFSVTMPNDRNALYDSTFCVFSDSYFRSIELPGNLTDDWLRNVFGTRSNHMNGFINYYVSQGRRAGIYIYNGNIWRIGTMQNVNQILALRSIKITNIASKYINGYIYLNESNDYFQTGNEVHFSGNRSLNNGVFTGELNYLGLSMFRGGGDDGIPEIAWEGTGSYYIFLILNDSETSYTYVSKNSFIFEFGETEINISNFNLLGVTQGR